MLRRECVGYWCYTLEVKEEEIKVEDLPVVCEFPDVFLEEPLGIPHQWEIDFKIELIPNAQPIFKAPYQMAPIELKKLNTQLEELL